MTQRLTAADVDQADLGDWQMLARALHARFATGDFATGLTLATAIGKAADEANHHPDLDLRYPHLDVALISHDVGSITRRDIDMARRISALAADLGVPARPEQVARLEVALDTADRPAQLRFWSALLDVDPASEDDLIDSSEQLPVLWFQDTDAHETPRQRFHLDLWVPAALAADRIETALEAGGTMVDAEQAPAFWVLADPEGNRVCVCTSRSRE